MSLKFDHLKNLIFAISHKSAEQITRDMRKQLDVIDELILETDYDVLSILDRVDKLLTEATDIAIIKDAQRQAEKVD